MENTTIVAIATPLGSGGVSIVRMSGSQSLTIASQVFSCKTPVMQFHPRMMYLGTFTAADFQEQCLAVYFKSPYSYTGEDVMEFQCHGGRMIAQGIVETLLSHGAILAQAGEFSKRAFVNGKLSLDQAEGIMEMIEAQSQSEIRAGYQLLKGKLQSTILSMQNELTTLLASIEVSLDYPEEDIEEETRDRVIQKVQSLLSSMDQLLKTKHTGKIIRDGVKIALVGKPNTGKSSLMNALLGYERAIVTNIQGTTRDIIEEYFMYRGLKFCLVDTAGIRQSQDVVEKIGIEKSWNALSYANILLVVLDGSQPLTKEDIDVLQHIPHHQYFILINKNDLPLAIDEEKISSLLSLDQKSYEEKRLYTSATLKDVEEIKEKLYQVVSTKDLEGQGVVLTNFRHIECLERAKQSLEKALLDLQQNQTLDIVCINLKDSWLAMGDVTGNSQNESIITEIFEKFCVGK